MNRFFATRARAIVTSAFLVAGAIGIGLGANVAYSAMTGSPCCFPGSPCCYPGSPCCAHAGVASR
jgi:hypothetical protein